MATLDTIAPIVQERLEETGSGQFWDLQTEIYPLIVEGLLEASLLSGEVQVRRTPSVSLVMNQTIQSVPPDLICLSKIENQNGAMGKTSVQELDRMRPDWQNEVGEIPMRWAPLGLTRYVIYPKVTVPANVVLSGLVAPAPAVRPYTGTEPINFPVEFQEGFTTYASGVARLKEGGLEMQQGVADYDAFLSQMLTLSKFAIRKGSLRFSRAMGFSAKPVETTQQ